MVRFKWTADALVNASGVLIGVSMIPKSVMGEHVHGQLPDV
jgi:hypothetical protein